MSFSFPIDRPVVRSFSVRFSREAAAWVRSGGHAVVFSESVSPKGRVLKRAMLVVGVIDESVAGQLSLFSLLDLGKKRWKTASEEPFKGLTTAMIPARDQWIVRNRIERDSQIEGPTQTVSLNCMACGACCKANEVVLGAEDLERFVSGGRADLTKPPFVKRHDGKLVMTLLGGREKRCRHLDTVNGCEIYPLRPAPCRDFPAASECCLFTREAESITES